MLSKNSVFNVKVPIMFPDISKTKLIACHGHLLGLPSWKMHEDKILIVQQTIKSSELKTRKEITMLTK